MAIKKIEDIPEEYKFGRLLFKLGQMHGVIGPAQISSALYKNIECFKTIQPGGHKFINEAYRTQDIHTISKAVQRNFKCKSACEVPSQYLLAYHILFNCSLDYLYGIIEDPCPNAEIKDISEKTGLSFAVIEKLMSQKEIYTDDYLSAAYQYDLFTGAADDDYPETNRSITKFWDKILQSDSFDTIPQNWYRMACALYISKAMNAVADSAKSSWDELPEWETFRSWKENVWDVHHPDLPIFIPHGLTLKEAYKQYPEWAKETYREMRNKHYYSAVDKQEDFETAYWGCAGKFDRVLLDYFHQEAEKWCNSGSLPKFW